MNYYTKMYGAFTEVSKGVLFSENTELIECLAAFSGFDSEVEALKSSAENEITITGTIVHKGFSIFDVHLFSSPTIGELSCVVIPNFILNRTDISKMKEGFPFLNGTEEYYNLVEHLSNMILDSLKKKSSSGHQYGMWVEGDEWGFEIKGAFEPTGFSTN